MTTKKASQGNKKTPKPSKAPSPGGEINLGEAALPEAMRKALAKAAHENDSRLCRGVEDWANNFIRDECAKKQFTLSSGNCNLKECQTVEEPRIEPCVTLRWGDGQKDQLETEDTEVLCITVCNPYSNVSLNDFTMQIVVLNADGSQVANLPDGTPSVFIRPSHMICFDDVPPCNPQRPEESCVSRQVVLITRGAKVGAYRILIFYCFNACFTKAAIRADFVLDLVAS
ncbi:MAG TPA: hypothetical protein VER76_06745 [Pyrinomonadaceae bacterium]|nr:hypothetical protein [Pyrinomonadaceae bacterium]